MNTTLVESYQKKFGRRRSTFEAFEEVLGTNHYLWLVPVPPILEINYNEEVRVLNL